MTKGENNLREISVCVWNEIFILFFFFFQPQTVTIIKQQKEECEADEALSQVRLQDHPNCSNKHKGKRNETCGSSVGAWKQRRRVPCESWSQEKRGER
jgi:hypothetical protein